jgi:hypothetical protein
MMSRKQEQLRFKYDSQLQVLRCLNRSYTVKELSEKDVDSAIMMTSYFYNKWNWHYIDMPYSQLETEYHVALVF